MPTGAGGPWEQPPQPLEFEPGRSGPGWFSANRKLVVLVAAVVAVGLVVGVAIYALGMNKGTSHNADNDGSAAVTTSLFPPTTDLTTTSVPPVTTTPSVATPTTTLPPAPQTPTTASHIDLSQVATAPHLVQVARLLDTYFTGINNHDARQAASVFAPNGSVNPNNPTEIKRFAHGISTTHDDLITVLSITDSTFAQQPGLAVSLRFRSHQSAALGRNKETCTKWALTEELVQVGAGYKLFGSKDSADQAC